MDRLSDRKTNQWGSGMLLIVLTVVGYFLLVWVILPRLGVPT
jgi:hypothetical protein